LAFAISGASSSPAGATIFDEAEAHFGTPAMIAIGFFNADDCECVWRLRAVVESSDGALPRERDLSRRPAALATHRVALCIEALDPAPR
jgi:hypothetical protein